MPKQAIYMVNGHGGDPAIQRGLAEAGCEVICTHSIVETLNQFKSAGFSIGVDQVSQRSERLPVVLVAEVQAGAIPLLTLLREKGAELPPTLIFDRDGADIRVAIKALQLGVKEYLLASDSAVNRELCACVLAQREGQSMSADIMFRTVRSSHDGTKTGNKASFVWDRTNHVVHVGTDRLRLSPIEGRIFDMLYANRGQIVTVKDFVDGALKKPALDPVLAARQLRPHLMRLRRKLNRYSPTASHIVNTRGSGYMLV